MATTIDHLRDNYIVRVIQDFADARGVEHRVGEEGRIINLALNFQTRGISLDGTVTESRRRCFSTARECAFDANHVALHHWLREEGIGLWYGWGSGASSGGEGTYRSTYIRAAEKVFADIDRAREGLLKQSLT